MIFRLALQSHQNQDGKKESYCDIINNEIFDDNLDLP